MKNNQPVTQRDIDYPESLIFITKTDPKGAITYTNDAFVEISGFSRGELIGVNHNIVRHPDMPAWAFADLWKTIKSGRPWRGVVKNRAKNGDHYWVRATVSPIIEQGGITGYLSLRRKPSRSEIAAAEMLYKSGSPQSGGRSLSDWFRNLSLQAKLHVFIQPALLALLGLGSYMVSDHIRSQMLDEAQKRAEGIANEVIDSANMLMVTGQISDPETRQLLIKKISSSGNIIGLHPTSSACICCAASKYPNNSGRACLMSKPTTAWYRRSWPRKSRDMCWNIATTHRSSAWSRPT